MPNIRTIHPDEWSLYREVRLRALQDAPDAFGGTYAAESSRPDEMWASRVEAASTSGKDLPLFAEDEGHVCGLVWCKVATEDPSMADVYQMWVAPTARGKGIGKALLLEVVQFARTVGVRRLRLGVTLADSPALHLYQSFGFTPLGSPVALREGSEALCQTMVLDLPPP